MTIQPLSFSATDDVTPITTGQKFAWNMDEARDVQCVRGTLLVPQTSGPKLTVDVKHADGSSIFSTPLTFDNGQVTTAGAVVPAVINAGTLVINERFTAHVLQIGDGTAKGLKLTLYPYVPDFGAPPPPPPPPTKTWHTIASAALDATSGAVQGYTYRFALAHAGFSTVTDGEKIRLTIKAALNAPTTVAKMYVGPVATAPNAASLTQVTFGGNPGVTIAAGGQAVSDELTFALDPTKDLLVTFEPTTPVLYTNPVTGWTRWAHAVTGEADDLSVSGYFSYNWQILISKIEVYAS